jgi:hypothetical protein
MLARIVAMLTRLVDRFDANVGSFEGWDQMEMGTHLLDMMLRRSFSGRRNYSSERSRLHPDCHRFRLVQSKEGRPRPVPGPFERFPAWIEGGQPPR